MGNIALNGLVSADSTVNPFTADRAVDGTIEATHRWVGETPCSLKLTCIQRELVNRWVISNMSAVTGWPSPNYNMVTYSLQGSNDNSNWTTIDAIAGNTITKTDRMLVTPAYFLYYRIYISSGLKCNSKIASIMDFQLYNTNTSPYLSNLTISNATMSPTFGKNVYNYTATVGNDVESVTITPTAEEPTYQDRSAAITVNGVITASGSGAPVNLSVGVNNIEISVTSAVGGVVQKYYIAITRQDSNYLSNLVLMNGTNNISLNPVFASAVLSYKASVSNDVTAVSITATSKSPNASLTINGLSATSGQPFAINNLVPGDNNITITVTVPGMPVQNYTVTVSAEDLYLTALKVGPNARASITLTPSFEKHIKSYTGANSAINSLYVTATAEASANVNLSVNGNPAVSGTAISVPVTSGQSNAINITVTSKTTGATNTYTCTIAIS